MVKTFNGTVWVYLTDDTLLEFRDAFRLTDFVPKHYTISHFNEDGTKIYSVDIDKSDVSRILIDDEEVTLS